MYIDQYKSKISIFVFLLLCIWSGVAKAQVTNQDSTKINIENPMEMVQETLTIKKITIVGNRNYNRDFILSTAELKEGDQIKVPGPKISNAIKQLFQTGLFSDVRILQTNRTGDTISLEIHVREQPRLAGYIYKGIKHSERSDLKDKMPLLTGFAVTKSQIEQSINVIKRFFANKGYWGTTVKVSKVDRDTAQNRVKLEFDINKGKRLEIKRIHFYGAKAFSQHKLRKELKGVHQDAWWRIFTKAVFKKKKFGDAKDHLISFYQDHGFRDARIVRDSVYTYNFKPGKKGIGIDIYLQEGPKYYVRNIKWEGNTVYTDKQLSTALGFNKGDVFDQSKFDNNLNINKNNTDVTSMYQDIGYLFFQVNPEFRVVHHDSLDIIMHITEDKIAHIREVEIKGNTRTHDDVVRRNLRTLPGAVYSRSNIMRSVRELAQLKYFVAKDIKPNLDYDYQNKTVNIIYNLKESAGTDNFEFSGGFGGQGIGLILSARLNFNNFSIQNLGKQWPIPSGDGQQLSLGAQVTGGGYQSFDLGFNEPWFNGRPVSLGFNVSYSLYKYNSLYSTTGTNERDQLFSVSVSSTRRLNWPDDYFSQSSVLQYQHYDVYGSVYNTSGLLSTLTLKEIIQRNSIDNPINPTVGSDLMLSGEIAPPLAGLAQYYKIKFKYQHHITIIGKLVLTNGLEMGYMGWLGKKDRSPYERFYLGGTQLQQQQTFTQDDIDLKGYPGGYSGSISPMVNGTPVGGTMYTKYDTELRYPVVSNDQVQLIPYLFAEGGNAYLGFKNFQPFNIKRSAGFGLRIFLPILGLVDLSYGYRFDGIPNTSVQPGQWEFLFNIGSPFQ